MTIKQKLKKIKGPEFDAKLKIGNKIINIEVKSSPSKKGMPFKNLLKNLKKASKEGILEE